MQFIFLQLLMRRMCMFITHHQLTSVVICLVPFNDQVARYTSIWWHPVWYCLIEGTSLSLWLCCVPFFFKKNNVDVTAEFGEWVLLKLMFTFVVADVFKLLSVSVFLGYYFYTYIQLDFRSCIPCRTILKWFLDDCIIRIQLTFI